MEMAKIYLYHAELVNIHYVPARYRYQRIR